MEGAECYRGSGCFVERKEIGFCVIRNGKVLTIKDYLPKKVLLEAERYLRERELLVSDNSNLSDYA